jgi:hypothetical protein
MAVAHRLKRLPSRNKLRKQGGLSHGLDRFNDGVHLDENRPRPYHRAHDQRRDPRHRSPPPYLSGMGGHLRLRYQPLPPDPVRGFFLITYAV